MYVSFIGLRFTKTSLTLINRTRLRTTGPQVLSIISTTNYLDIQSSILDRPQFELSVILSTVDIDRILRECNNIDHKLSRYLILDPRSTAIRSECKTIDRRYRPYSSVSVLV